MAIRIPINLASTPFRRDRPVFVASLAACAVLAVLLLTQVGTILSQRQQAAETRESIERLTRQMNSVNFEQRKFDAMLGRPENREVLERSLFLNTLIERKSISWTKLFGDLQQVMPRELRLVSVRLPQVNSQNQVLLDMVVSGKDVTPVLEFLKKLEAAPQFGPASLVTSLPPSQTDPSYRFHITVNYAQKL